MFWDTQNWPNWKDLPANQTCQLFDEVPLNQHTFCHHHHHHPSPRSIVCVSNTTYVVSPTVSITLVNSRDNTVFHRFLMWFFAAAFRWVAIRTRRMAEGSSLRDQEPAAPVSCKEIRSYCRSVCTCVDVLQHESTKSLSRRWRQASKTWGRQWCLYQSALAVCPSRGAQP